LTNKEELLYSAQAIVYTKPDSFAEWKLLAVSGPVCNSTWEAVESLYCELQEQLGKMTGKWKSRLWLIRSEILTRSRFLV
jgi:hypothetical protein